MANVKDYKELLTTPIEAKIRNFPRLAQYYLYYAPNINSAHSVHRIEGADVKAVFNSMIAEANLSKRYKIVKKVMNGVWKSNQLEDDVLNFEPARFTCDQYSHESELNAVLRHIRNAFAHGYIYVWKKKEKNGRKNFVYLTDYDSNKKKITAKMMLSVEILEKWKAILENQIATVSNHDLH